MLNMPFRITVDILTGIKGEIPLGYAIKSKNMRFIAAYNNKQDHPISKQLAVIFFFFCLMMKTIFTESKIFYWYLYVCYDSYMFYDCDSVKHSAHVSLSTVFLVGLPTEINIFN